MNREELWFRIVKHTRELTGVEVLTEALGLEDVGFDSLDAWELTIRLEEEFGVYVDDDAVERWHTLGDVLATLARLVP